MKDIIKRILKEESSLTPKMDYYKRIAKMIVDNSIEIDHENRVIYFPFSGGYSRRRSFDGGLTDYVQKSKDEGAVFFTKDFPTYVDQMYGLDVSDNRGILMAIMKLIERHLYKKVSSEIKGNERYN
jgi:hypothetical protein